MTSRQHCLVVLCLWSWAAVEKTWAVTSNQPPVFVSFSSALFLAEDTPVGSVLGQLRATDSDDTQLTFFIGGDIANQLLDLQAVSDTSADIILSQPLDRESVEQYSIDFIVSDGQNTITRGTHLYITDVNDNAPLFLGLPYRAEIREDSAIGATIFQVSSSDPDSGILGLPNYVITTPQGMFSVDQGSGYVTLTSTLDYETERFYQLEIMATDGGGLNSTTDLVINVIDVSDTAPFFINLPYMATIVENVSVGTNIMQVTAQDGDRGISNPVVYSIAEGGNEYFSLDENTGIITMAQTLDREDPAIRDMFGVIDITIQASEVSSSPSGPTSAMALVTVTIEDINDQAPTFSQLAYEASVLENTQTRIPITFLPDGTEMIVQDYDMGDNGRFRLFLEKDGQPYDTFEVVPSLVINEATVLLRVLNADALDYETTQTLTFQVVAQEHLTPEGRTSRADVTVNILDMNDHWPMFEEDIYAATIPENSPKGSSVIQITATDADSGAFGEITYRIQGSSANLFTIDESTSEITVAVDADLDHTLLDRETVAIHYLTLIAIDDGGLRTLVQVIVTLSDVNDNAPSIARVEYEGYVEENGVELERQLFIQATDLDLPPNSDITYELMDGDFSQNFLIDASSGEITLSSALDYEAIAPSLNGLLELHVTAVDGGSPPLNGSALVVIYLQDKNDEIPVFNSSSYSAVIPENSQQNTFVTQVFAEDADGTAPNNELIYRIESGARDKFRIDGQTGLITIESGANLDRDIYGHQYTLDVLGIDRGTPSLTGFTTVTVTITDMNNKDPVFQPTSASVSIPENSAVGQEVYTYTATDADHDALLSYSLVEDQIEGEDDQRHPVTDHNYLNSLFGIHASNGSVFVQRELNREMVEEVTLVVMVEDTNAPDPSPQQATARLTIILLDINDNAPIFIPSDVYTARISEASQPGIEVKQVLAIDSDETSGPIQYSLNYPSPESQAFEITDANRETGVVTLKDSVDREQSESVRLIVLAEDQGSPRLTGFAMIEVTIEDVNDNSPEWVTFESSVTVWENATAGTILTTVQATDDDTGVYGEINYFMSSGNSDIFRLDPNSGELVLIGAIDREEADEYKLTIEARDNNQAAISDQRRTPGFMTIVLRDVNDNPPVFDLPTYTASSVQENFGIGTQVLTVHAVDADSGDNGHISYSIDPVHTNASTLFAVGETTGIVTVAELLKGNVGWFLVTVRASDHGQTQQSGTTEVYVFIVDVNDHPPVIVEPAVNAIIPVRENMPPGTFVVRVEATDEDEGLNGQVLYEFVENPPHQDWTKFTINTTTGNIYTSQTIDREAQEMYYLDVRAFDRAAISYDDRRSITIVALDVDDNEPKFNRITHPPPIRLFAEEEKNGTEVGSVNLATDPDTGNNSMVCYFLVGNPEDYPFSSHFRLNKTSGVLSLHVALDHETIQSVEVLVKATHECAYGDYNADSLVWDSDDESLLLVEVLITDINDNGPIFTKTTFSAGVTRDTQYGEEVINLSEYVTDIDGPNHREHRFHIIPEIEIISNELRDQVRAGGEMEVFVMNPVTGIISTNIYFQQNMHGYFVLHLKVDDGVDGHEDTADASIYLLNEEQRAKVVVWGTPQEIAEIKDDFADYLSNITGYVINVDKIQTHRDALGSPNERKTDMYIHAIHYQTGEVLDATVLIDLIDRNYATLDTLFKKYNVIEIVPAIRVESTAAVEGNIQLALIIIAALLFLLLVIVCATFFTCRNKYKRKLKAATAMAFDTNSGVHIGNGFASTRTLSTLNGTNGNGLTHMEVPGTNMHAYEGSNPIWFEQYENGWAGESDTESKNSIDRNALATGRMKSYDEVEASLDMYNDENDQYNQLPAKEEADIYLTAALSHRDRYAHTNGDAKAGHQGNKERMNGSANHVNNQQAHTNPAFSPDDNGSGIIAHMHTSNI